MIVYLGVVLVLQTNIFSTIKYFCSATHHVHPVHGAELEGLVLGVEHHVDHGADLGGEHVGGGVQQNALVQLGLECSERPENDLSSYFSRRKQNNVDQQQPFLCTAMAMSVV